MYYNYMSTNKHLNIMRILNNKTKKISYINRKSKKVIDNQNILDHIQSLHIPPAYKNVIISSNKNDKILAIGTDTKNRQQYIYNKTYIEQQKHIKFSNLHIFGKKIKRIRKDITENLLKCSQNKSFISNKKCMISLILYLIDKCNFRVGCEKYKDLYKSYGVTTLNKTHFKFNKNNVVIEFIGKKGVKNKAYVKNKLVCNLLKQVCNNNNSEYLFTYVDDDNNKYRITETHINNYLKKYNKLISVKMFRTWSANYILLREILNYPLPKSENEAKKNISRIIKKAAFFMHHTTNVSRKSYMNTEIIDLYLNNFNNFKNLIEKFRKENGNLPNLDRLLNLLLFSL
jgi:DNA topoisomerase I